MLPYGSVDTLSVSVLILLFYNSIIFCAIHITHGMVAMDSSEDVPTPCAEKPGEMSYSSAGETDSPRVHQTRQIRTVSLRRNCSDLFFTLIIHIKSTAESDRRSLSAKFRFVLKTVRFEIFNIFYK